MTALRLYLAGTMPLTPDEAYYREWSHHLQGGYLDHPFMVALWIRIGTWLAGDSPLGARFLGPISVLPGSFFLFCAARNLFGQDGARIGIRAVWLLNATLMVGLGCATMTPDTPLVFFTTLTVWALSVALKVKHTLSKVLAWSAVGGGLGLGFDSKYTAVLVGAAMACGLLLNADWRRRLSPWCAVPAFLLSAAPVIWWNKAHHWASFIKQGGRTGDWHPARAAQFLGELIGGQIGLATPLVFAIFAMGLVHAYRRRAEVGAYLLCWIALLPLCVFLQHALGDRVQANWPAVVYPAWALIGALSLVRVRWAVASGCAIFVLVAVHAVYQVPALAPNKDPVARQTAGWERFASDAASLVQQKKADAVAAEDYGVASKLAEAGLKVPVIGLDPRWQFLGLAAQPFQNVLIINDIHPNSPKGEVICRSYAGHAIRCYRVTVSAVKDGVVLP
ncbi:ArnT family glycosyltransferase [Neokomagataea tanensis]|uniref:ArnT family glycosyltransferase n=1 Tax=Neokomagataea TaxID=1223423 RepID=UPI001F1013A3|nr:MULTISPECIES: glycosyltransferase family 39 protein [Neokomagataea]